MTKEERAKKKRVRKIKSLTVAAILILVLGAVLFALFSPMFNVENYEITGSTYYTNSELEIMGKLEKGGNIFTGIDIKDMKSRLLADAFIESMEITRKLPDTIKINIVEKEQFCALKYGSKYIVLAKDKTVLRRASVEPELPLITGITISKMNVGEKAEVEEMDNFDRSIEVLNAMYKNNMYFKSISVSGNEVEAHILENLICKGSFENIINCLIENKIQSATYKLFEQNIERGTILVISSEYISFSPEI